MKIGCPDGDGVFGVEQFWKDYFSILSIEYVEASKDLNELDVISTSKFPSNICLNSRYRLGRFLLLAERVTHLLLFLRSDEYVDNCPASVYRIKWMKEYIKSCGLKIETIIFPHDFSLVANFNDNLVALASHLINSDLPQALINKIQALVCPQRVKIYEFGLSTSKKNILLIGVVSHVIDPFRESTTMNYLIGKFGILTPRELCPANTIVQYKNPNTVTYYKEDAIKSAIDYALNNRLISGVAMVCDPFDTPGLCNFPIIEMYLHSRGISKFTCEDQNCDKKLKYLILKVTNNNTNNIKFALDRFYDAIP